ncbi:MAG TPA: helix-turn-helix domain-containing protein [Nocardioidaceae bacterium]
MQSPSPRWTRLDPRHRREQILDVARRHFAERHYDAVSTAELAADAGVNRGLVYHYFGTKRELYLEVLKTTLRVPRLPWLLLADGEGSLREQMEAEIADWLVEVEENREAWLAASRAVGFGRDPEVEDMVRAARDAAIDEALATVYRDPADVPTAVRGGAAAVAGFAEAAIVEWLDQGRLSRDQVRVLITDAMVCFMDNLDRFLTAAPVDGRSRRAVRGRTTSR